MSNEIIKSIDWKPKWDDGAPMPQVFSNGHKVYLIYRIAEWDEKSIDNFEIKNHESKTLQFIALVEFEGHTFRFGIANDEVFQGLPYYQQGIKWAQKIENSEWIMELKQIHKIHPYYKESLWTDLKHYLLLFKDEILEVIAEGYKIEIFKSTYERLGQEIVLRINKNY